MKLAKFVGALALVGSGLVGLSPRAAAQDIILVLGVNAVTGDDAFAHDLTRGLRHESANLLGWVVSNREVSLNQVTLAYGCDEPTPECLEQIATDLDAQALIFGTVRRSGDSYTIELHYFAQGASEIARSISDVVPRVQSDVDHMRPRITRYVAELTGSRATGTITVASDVPNAVVRLDGEAVGHTDDEGNLTLNDVPAGSHIVEIASAEHDFSTTIEIQPDENRLLEVSLAEPFIPEDPYGSVDVEPARWPAYVMFGSGGLFFGLTIFSWVKISNLDGDPQFLEYRGMIDSNRDACAEARADTNTGDPLVARARQVCDQAETHQILQYVFLASSAVSLGVGLWLLLRGRRNDEPHDDSTTAPQLTLLPEFHLGGGGFSAQLEY